MKPSTIELDDPETAPVDFWIDIIDLELDPRLKSWTPPSLAGLWDEFRPSGRLSIGLRVVRDRRGGPVGFGLGIHCLDVAMTYKYFPYPIDHVRGLITWEGNRVKLDLQTYISGQPLHATGTIDNPGDLAHVQLDFQSRALPIDKTLFEAMPPDIRKVVTDFEPSGTVAGHAHVDRTPPVLDDRPPRGLRQDRRRARPERALLDEVGWPAVPGDQPHRPARASSRALGL